jgi:uncharacterized membrane protein YeaQ/YmgE (transglycosylase-associated protein family)
MGRLCRAQHGGILSASLREGTMDLIVWLIVGGVAGWLAGLIVKGYGYGIVWNIVIGIVGSLIAGWLLPKIGIFNVFNGIVGAIVYSVIGAVILLLIVGLIKR